MSANIVEHPHKQHLSLHRGNISSSQYLLLH